MPDSLVNINADTIHKLLKLVDDATQFFGPCWCKPAIGFKCPQCFWRQRHANMIEHVTPKKGKK